MPERSGYGQFCPVSMAAEVFCSRWTPLVMRELLAGTSRFNDLRRGVPRMSPALLSKRLKELEKAGIVSVSRGKGGAVEYGLTPAGHDLKDVVIGLGMWGARWVESATLAAQSRPDAADVGHAPPAWCRSRCRRAAARYSFSTPNCRRRSRTTGWWSTAARSTSATSIPDSRSTCWSARRCGR